MKKYIILSISFVLFSVSIFAQTFEYRTLLNDQDYIAVQLRQTALGGQLDPLSTADDINDMVFTIRWLQTLGDVDVDIICTNYNITESGTRTASGLYYFQDFSISTAFVSPDNFVLNEWLTIATLQSTITSGSTSGAFDVAPDGWPTGTDFLIITIGWDGGASIEYTASEITGAANNTPIPTVIYDLVWTGTDGTYPTYWDIAANWETECGGTGTIPNTGNNCFIPVVSSGNYPINVGQVTGFGVHQPVCDNLRIATGASMSIDNEDFASVQATYTVNNDLAVYGTLTIIPNGQLSVDGDTYIDAADGIIVQADVTGVGSFLDDKAGSATTTITYGTSGTAKVQTYITNGSIDNSFYMHLMGPTLDEENYAGSGTGAFLQAFDVAPGNTYAYSFDEPSGLWVNQFSYTYPVLTTDGIAMSTDDAAPYTMNMSGALMTGSITSIALTSTAGGPLNYELISNPYPSAIDFDLFFANTGNSAVINNKNWVWDASAGNYLARSGNAGGVQFIQVGQAFFVETYTAGTLAFDNTNRVHSTSPFREVIPNVLSLDIAGGDYGYYDQLVIRFEEGATTGYDFEIEAIKWNSMYENATQIRSIAEDGTELSVNVMPELNLQGETVSVPVNFECGYEGEYTFTAGDLESFEYGTEIWIEDKQDNYQWHHLSPGHETYTFTASPDDAPDRFIIHFFGPTSVNDFEAQDVMIYSLNEYAYVKNLTKNEVIKEVYIYSLAGTMIMNKRVPEQNIYRFFVSNHDGYYIVRVVTDKNIYTGKVFVH